MPGIVPPATLLTQTAVVDTNKDVYSFADLQNLWIQAGGDAAKAKVAAAVAMAESRGHRKAQNRNSDGSIDRGLWQINSAHGAASTFDVRGNARAAVAISKNGTNWRPWVTFKSGAYIPFLRGASVPAGTIASGGSVPGVTDLNVPAPDAVKSVAGFLSRLDVLFERDWWKRVGLVLAGAVALLIGIMFAAKQFMKDMPALPIVPL